MNKPVQVLDDHEGKPVDWWFMYKLPEGVGPSPARGYHYLYYDAHSKGRLGLAPRELDRGDSALHNTLNALFAGDANYILYNDESPQPGASDSGSRGHVKGILAFDRDSDSALLLTHSTPRFPLAGQVELPDDERKYGQTYLCISLENYATATVLAHQIRHMHQPQVYATRIDDSLAPGEDLSLLAQGQFDKTTALSSAIEFRSAAGESFHSFAKSRRWGRDFWLDLVGPSLKSDLLVESWVRGKMPPGKNAGEKIEDIFSLDFSHIGLAGVGWKETKDHAKWAVSVDQKTNLVCVGDLNRMISQEKRGGGTIAFANPRLWKSLYQAHDALRHGMGKDL